MSLIPRDDLALAAMHERRVRQLAGAAAQQPRRPAPGDGVAAAAAPGRRFDAQRAEPRERLAQAAVAFGDQKRQAEHAAPATAIRRRCRRFRARRTAAATAPDRRVRARRRSRSAPARLRHRAGSRRRETRRPACSTPCACRATERRSTTRSRCRSTMRRRSSAASSAASKRTGREKGSSRSGIARRGPTRQRSCRLPFDASKTRRFPPGCCRPVAATMPRRRRDRLKNPG